MTTRTLLITGATGKQGGATIRSSTAATLLRDDAQTDQ